jgi:outer membrane protein
MKVVPAFWVLMAAPVLMAQAGAAGAVSAREPLRLSMKRAVDLAVSPEGNANIQIAGEAVKQAQSREVQARAALLPGLDAAVSEQSVTRNLAALGISSISLPFLPGFSFPTFVGPFNVFDARISGTQSIFDFSSIRRLQASRVGVKAARASESGTGDQVAAQVAKAYLAALRAQADLDTSQANVALAEALLKQAENQKAAGTGTGIEVTRARVQLSNERQRLLVSTDGRRRARLQLLRAIGLRLDTEIELTDALTYVPVDALTLEQAQARAMGSRADLAAQRERQDNARLSASATKMERLPSVAAFGDYGPSGSAINNSLPTRTYGISLRLPIFDGGRRDARRTEAESQYRQERVRTDDLKQQIELDVRLALDSLRSAEEQVKVAEEGLGLSENELAQARRRYEAGVATGIEVTDAQTRLERARDNRVEALFNYSAARIDLGVAMGTIRGMIQ